MQKVFYHPGVPGLLSGRLRPANASDREVREMS
jgi:hypothetical protein